MHFSANLKHSIIKNFPFGSNPGAASGSNLILPLSLPTDASDVYCKVRKEQNKDKKCILNIFSAKAKVINLMTHSPLTLT